MKIVLPVLISLFSLIPITSFASSLECDVVTSVDEDIIRITEYPTVSISDSEATLGAAFYSIQNGDSIVEHFNGFARAIRIQGSETSAAAERFELIMNTQTGAATLSYFESAISAPQEFATLVCR